MNVMIAAYVKMPTLFRMNDEKAMFTLPPEDGMSMRATPLRKACVEMVMIIAGMRNLTTPIPFTSPVSAPTASARAIDPTRPRVLS